MHRGSGPEFTIDGTAVLVAILSRQGVLCLVKSKLMNKHSKISVDL